MKKSKLSKNLFRFSTIAIAIFSFSAASSSEVENTRLDLSLQKADTAEYRRDRVVVRFKTDVVKAGITANVRSFAVDRLKASLPSSFGAASVKAMGELTEYAAVSFDPESESVDAVMAQLRQHADVESVQPDFIYRKTALPNDTDFGRLWGLKNTAQTIPQIHLSQSLYTTANPGTSGKDMKLETAWDKITDCSNVVVAVIDTGVDLDHSDLVDNLWRNGSNQHGYDFVNNDTVPDDDEGHGTHVAGTIGARGNNGTGTTGVCWRVKIMAIKVLDENGSGSTSAIAAGISYAQANGAHIINMSLGGGGFDSAFQSAVNAASAAGILLVVAAGNSSANVSTSPSYPCAFPAANLICVGAVDQNFAMASFSNYSTTHVDIGAPGTNVVSQAIGSFQTEVVSLDSADWTLNNANFAHSTGPDAIQNPANWNGSTNLYAASADDRAYTSIDMSGTIGGILIISLRGALQTNVDYLDFYARPLAGDPMNSSSALVGSFSGTSGGVFITGSVPVMTCANAAICTLGLHVVTDGTNQQAGVRITSMQVDKINVSTTGQTSLNGTSMASPHVAGLAALLKAYNPQYTAADLRDVILNSGTKEIPLTSRFSKGSVVNADAALKHIPKPEIPTVSGN